MKINRIRKKKLRKKTRQVIKIMTVKKVKQDQQLKIMEKPTHRMKNKMESNQKKRKMEKGKTQKKSREK